MDGSNFRDRFEGYDHLLWPFFPGTREWLFTRTAEWAKSRSKAPASRVFLLHGPANIGKSVFALELCHRFYIQDVFSTKPVKALRMSKAEKRKVKRRLSVVRDEHEAIRANDLTVLGFYFFNYAAGHRDAVQCIRSISQQLAAHLEEFKVKPEANSNIPLEQLFKKLVGDPACKVKARKIAVDGKVVCLIDGIDECEQFQPLANVILAAKLPTWLGFVVTMRTQDRLDAFQDATKVRLGAESKDNMDDLGKYIDRKCALIVLEEGNDSPAELRKLLLDRAAGYFANLRFLHSLLNSNPQAEEAEKVTLRVKDIEEELDPVASVEESRALFERLHGILGHELYQKLMCPLVVATQRGLNLPLRLLQESSGFAVGKDDESFQHSVLDQLTHLFRVDRKRKEIAALSKDILAWMKNAKEADGKTELKIHVESKEAHALMAKLCQGLMNNPDCERYCRSYIVWHHCESEQCDALVEALCTDLDWLMKVLQYCNVAKEMEAYFKADVVPELKEVLNILTNGHTAVLHDHREIVSQILGRSNKTQSKLWQQASTFRFPNAGSWKPMKATLELADTALIQTTQGHNGPILALRVSANNRYVYTGGADKAVKKWRSKDFQLVGTYSKHTWPVLAIGASPFTHKTFCSVSEGGEVILWKSNKSKRLNGHVGAVHCVRFAPRKEASFFATGGADATIRLWNVVKEEGGKRVLAQWKNVDNSALTAMEFTKDGNKILSGSEDGTVCAWSYEGVQLFTSSPHRGQVTSISLSPTNSDLFLSSSLDGFVRLWSLNEGKPTEAFKCKDEVQHASFGSDDSFVVACEGERVTLWNHSSSWKAVSRFSAHLDHVAMCYPCGGRFVSVSADSFIRVWDDPENITFAEVLDEDEQEEDVSSVEDEDSSDEDETDLFLNPTAKLKRRKSSKAKGSKAGGSSPHQGSNGALQHDDWITHTAFAPNSSIMATAAKDGKVGIWEVGTAQCKRMAEIDDGEINFVVFSPDSTLLFAGGRSLVVYESESLNPKKVIDLDNFVASSLTLSEDVKLAELVDATGSSVCLNLESEERVEDSGGVRWIEEKKQELQCEEQHIHGPPAEERFVGFTLDSAVNVQATLSPNRTFAAVTEGRKLHILKLEGAVN